MDRSTLPTLAEVLALPAVQRGSPRVLVGEDQLDRRVRWVHVSEVSDIASLLEGGELILSTGIALPEGAPELACYVADLKAADVTALAVEVGRRYRYALPSALVEAAVESSLPLIELRRVTPFVSVTQAVHTMILDARVQELIASDAAHQAFTELTVSGQGPQQVVDLVSTMSGRSVVYESTTHHALTYSCAPDAEPADVLAQWERIPSDRDEGDCWYAVQVSAPSGGTWGRLLMLGGETPTQRQRMLLDRGATALVINRLTDRQLDSLERHSHRMLLAALVLDAQPLSELAAEARTLGVPLERRSLTGVIVQPIGEYVSPRGTLALLHDLASVAGAALQAIPVPALVGALDDERVAMLLTVGRASDVDDTLDLVSERLHAVAARRSDVRLVIGAGSTVIGPERAQSTLREAMQVADAALTLPARKGYFRPPDLRLRGLVFTLRDEPALHDYVERELGPLLAHDADTGSQLYEFLSVFCRCGGRKTETAHALFISRPAVYNRILKVQQVLGVDLSDAEVVLGLHAAVLARETMRQPTLAVRSRVVRASAVQGR
ncbi:PucR family transcriptional regulator [Leekyejoonella antrihumi]|uniref:PucR family transcriptional regulator n=1 Tax=Leekyejoonella antrihumi TaxID=1660198 RepID=A0A563DVP2_9MICO|nr:PucR family transcriptional regulator [Leekyejoonella antrihumi]TWP34051.1 PucR family transcriptional regulator [Leekyejoonella antrihumi]